ncbi:MAG: DNA repair protein RecN [Lachnospiraceae bacterium]|nr:DNA repair protein RecN [Lachnospiraceae bacterium]
MLQSLHVKNLALIDEAEVELGKGLNIFTGETGAGKSLLLGSITLALGGKVAKELLRENQEYTLVELQFFVEEEKVRKELEELGVYFEEPGQILVSRKLVRGRSMAKVNGEIVSAAELAKITGLLLDIHGQHEHQSLLHPSKHLAILDEYMGKEALQYRNCVKEAYEEYRRALTYAETFQMEEEQRVRELSFLEFECQEIEEAALKEEEEEELSAWYKKAIHGKKIMETVARVYEEMNYDGMDSAGEKIGHAVHEIASIVEYDEGLRSLSEQISEIDNLLSDFLREVSSYMDSLEFDEGQFLEVEARLDLIHRLENKYGGSISAIEAYYNEKQERLILLRNYEAEKEEAERKKRETYQRLLEACRVLSERRKEAALSLTEKIRGALLELNFLDVQFEMAFSESAPSTNGFDQAEFLISTNPGQPIRPLGKVASGGELSRVMLAIKTVLSDQDGVDTLLFDEIDAGISGRTAQQVSEKLKQISRYRQILCITHLAQIASMADQHYLIEKQVDDGNTVTSIRELDREESIGELARILGGVKITDSIVESAREMKELAEQYK